MKKTKEEIKVEIISKLRYLLHYIDNEDLSVVAKRLDECLQLANKQYATQQQSEAVEFAEWLNKKYSTHINGWVVKASELPYEIRTIYSTSDLYSIFLKEKGGAK